MRDYKAVLILCAGAFIPGALALAHSAYGAEGHGGQEQSDRGAERLYQMPRAHYAPEETDEAYMTRMVTIATAIRTVPSKWRPYVAAVWINETHLAADVHAGEPGHFGSDAGFAKCLGQIHRHRNLTVEEWESLGGTDLPATTRCAAETARLLSGGAKMCGVTEPERVFDVYGKGNCYQKIAKSHRARRVRTLRKMGGVFGYK